MSNPQDDAPTPVEDQLTKPIEGVPQDISRVIGAAATLELSSGESITREALLIARSQLGEREHGGKNQGPIVQKVARPFLSAQRFAETYPKGALQWCAFFVCWCVLQALKAANATPEQISVWMHIASGSCGALHDRLTKLGLVTRHLPGEPVPEGTFFVFFGEDKDGAPHLTHVGAYDHTAGALLKTVEGNAGRGADQVCEAQHMIDDPRVHSTARLPF